MTRDRHQREAITNTEYVLLKQSFKLIVECADQPIGVIGGFDKCRGNWIAGKPKLYFPIINTIATTPNICARMLRISPSAHIRQVERGSRLIIANKNRHGGYPRTKRNSAAERSSRVA